MPQLPRLNIILATLVQSLTLNRVPLAHAEESHAKRLFDEGKQCLKNDDWVCACRNFQASADLSPRPSTWIKLAHCRQHEQHYVQAWAAFDTARSLFPKVSDKLWPMLDREIAAGRTQIPTLKLELPAHPAGLVVQIDGKATPSADLDTPLPVQYGRHQIQASAPGYVQFSSTIDVSEERTYPLVVALEGAPPEPPEPQPSAQAHPQAAPVTQPVVKPIEARPAASTRVDSPAKTQRVVGYFAAGVGIVGVGVATYEAIHTLNLVHDSNDDCPHPGGACDPPGVTLRNQATRAQNVGIVAGAAGLVGIAAGAYLLLTATATADSSIRINESHALSIVPYQNGLLGSYCW